MKVSLIIQSKFLRKEDVDDEILVTIKGLKLEDMPGTGGEQRWALYFKEQSKGMVVNTTTLRVLEKAFGDETNNWVDKRVALYVDPNVTFKGQVVGGLRLRPLKPPPPAEFDDVIP